MIDGSTSFIKDSHRRNNAIYIRSEIGLRMKKDAWLRNGKQLFSRSKIILRK
ncbi:hypothetical protein HanIR_Chr09g0438651 [Helianthus annuus]|nr:hypothetical protein HanIR_Chr09g0438651 [Helianthus annuus]